MAGRYSEDALCEVFADKLVGSDAFRLWLLMQTRFAGEAETARLLDREQMDLRPRKRWWRHWWCHVPALDHQRETDIFCVFDGQNRRFALHIENKLGLGRFLPGQAEGYAPRAAHMAGKAAYLGYTDYETLLLAPAAFVARFSTDCAHFDRIVTHESLVPFLPEFAAP
jgi:hypothetical protein